MPHLHLHILGSGSKGNCALVEGPRGLIMIDNGLSRREVLRRMAELSLDPQNIAALLLTHEHSDHTKGLKVWCKHWQGPMFASAGTPAARADLAELGFEEFEPGDELELAGVRVRSFSTSHDVVNPAGFRFECAGDSIGYATDTGTLLPGALELLGDARILALESNHDLSMLRCGPYPRYLQDRIASNTGHLSNAQAAEALPALVTKRTEHVVAMHISQENNLPSHAVRALAEALGAQLDNELGNAATLMRDGTAAGDEDGGRGVGLHITPASQVCPLSFL